MGVVYEVRRDTDDAPFALKVVREKIAKGKKTAQRLRREAQVLARLHHPGVVKMVDAGLTDSGHVFLVMELLEGETLLQYLVREAPVAPSTLVPIVDGIAAALDAVHQAGIVHRDLKPSNVIVTPSGVKLVDFGVAHGAEYVRLTVTGQVVGTVRFMSPEQLTGSAEIDHRTDVYALGIIVWASMAGGPPFTGNPMQLTMQIAEGAPRLDVLLSYVEEGLADVVHRAIAVRRDERPSSAGAFAREFREAAIGVEPTVTDLEPTGFAPIPATRTSVTEQVPPTVLDDAPKKGAAPIWYLAIGIVIGVALTMGAFFALSGGAEPPPDTAEAPTSASSAGDSE